MVPNHVREIKLVALTQLPERNLEPSWFRVTLRPRSSSHYNCLRMASIFITIDLDGGLRLPAIAQQGGPLCAPKAGWNDGTMAVWIRTDGQSIFRLFACAPRGRNPGWSVHKLTSGSGVVSGESH